jgi:hypothetical protein
MERISASAHPQMEWQSSEHFGAEVKVELKSGKILKAYQEKAIGRGPEIPLPPERLEAKFLDCWSQAYPRAAGAALMEKIASLEMLEDSRVLFESFSPAQLEKVKSRSR